MDLLAKEILKDVNLDEISAKASKPKNPVDHWSPPVLLERAAYLRKLAKHGDGSASETLKEYPQHCAMLSFRSRDGEAEVHERFADLFCVLAGKATLSSSGQASKSPGNTTSESLIARRQMPSSSVTVPRLPGNMTNESLIASKARSN